MNNIVGGIAGDQLRSFVERIERITEEKSALAADIREVYSEAKGNGFDVKTIRKVVSLRAIDKETLTEEEQLLDLYRRVLGL